MQEEISKPWKSSDVRLDDGLAAAIGRMAARLRVSQSDAVRIVPSERFARETPRASMTAELAERAGLTLPEFRARLNDAQIGASGHGLSWESRARALAEQIRKENQVSTQMVLLDPRFRRFCG